MTWRDQTLEDRQDAVARFVDDEGAAVSAAGFNELMEAAARHANTMLWSAGIPGEQFARKLGVASSYPEARAAAAALIDDRSQPLLPRGACYIPTGTREAFSLAREERWAFEEFAPACVIGNAIGRCASDATVAELSSTTGIEERLVPAHWRRWREIALVADVSTKAATIEAGGQTSTADAVADLPGGRPLTPRHAALGLQLTEAYRQERVVRQLVGSIRALPERFMQKNLGVLKSDERALIEGVRLHDRRLVSVAGDLGMTSEQAQQVGSCGTRKLVRLSNGLPVVDRDLEHAIERTASRSLSLRI